MSPEKMDAIDDGAIKELVTTYLDPSKSPEYTRMLYRVQILERERWTEEYGDRLTDEQSGDVEDDVPPARLRVMYGGLMTALRQSDWAKAVPHIRDVIRGEIALHHSPEPPDSTEPEDDVPRFPDQPLHRDSRGVVRFRQNAIVRFLLDRGGFDMNDLAAMRFSDEDRMQFAQLIGYSVSGYGELSYVSDAAYERAEKAQELLHDTGILTKERETP